MHLENGMITKYFWPVFNDLDTSDMLITQDVTAYTILGILNNNVKTMGKFHQVYAIWSP